MRIALQIKDPHSGPRVWIVDDKIFLILSGFEFMIGLGVAQNLAALVHGAVGLRFSDSFPSRKWRRPWRPQEILLVSSDVVA